MVEVENKAAVEVDLFAPPSSFDFGAATTQGFNLPGGKGYLIRVAGFTALFVTLIYVLLGGPVISAYIELFKNMFEMEFNLDGADHDPAVMLAAMGPIFKAMGLIVLISLFQMFVMASAESAIYRNLFYSEDKGVMPLRMGTDEWRVLGTRIVVGLILGGAYLGLYFVGAIIALLLIGLASVLGSGVAAALGGIVIFFLIVAAIAAFIWGAVRLAPASAYSSRNKEFNPFASWHAMKGRVWPAIGGFLILYLVGYFIISFVLGLVFMVLFFSSGILKVLTQIDVDSSDMPDFTPVWDHMTSAGFMIPLVLAIFFSMFLTTLWYGTIWSMWGYFAKTDQTVQD